MYLYTHTHTKIACKNVLGILYSILVRIFVNMEGLFLKGGIICIDFLQNTFKILCHYNCKNKGSYAICKLYTDI